jgi:meso-butanediol dehydrogenase/(S,S)-butanediol dehydrogenase/diacetyl reductase
VVRTTPQLVWYCRFTASTALGKEKTRRLHDKLALITGSGSGIGEATAKTFAREGATVVVTDIDDDNGHRVVEEIRQAGGLAEYPHADIGQTAEIEKMIAFAPDRFGRLDILHNNALFTVVDRIGDLSLEGWKKTLDRKRLDGEANREFSLR